jgi:F-type H+-transporting ATPase subunit delta
MAAFVSRYACAFADVVTEEKLDLQALDSQLNDFLIAWRESRGLRDFFVNPAIAIVEKVQVLDRLNAKLAMCKELRNLLAVLIRNDRMGLVEDVAVAYRAELKARLGIRQVEIVTARVLSEAERGELASGVQRLAGSKIEADFKQDASILGGTIVRIGSMVYDGSVRGRLERLKSALIAG